MFQKNEVFISNKYIYFNKLQIVNANYNLPFAILTQIDL